MDFPQIVASVDAETDAILAPSNDWTEAGPTHSRMARLRGIENGCWVIRPTKDGVSSLSDPYGRVHTSQLTDRLESSVLRCEASLEGVTTPYAYVGDTFAWMCLGLSCMSLLRYSFSLGMANQSKVGT
ncbi:MAG TPA: hypothetical protein DDW52_27300 [Planctomycetaceae bacterium]|nr:hypothetical protein [Planctomycetaceae bacterium]